MLYSRYSLPLYNTHTHTHTTHNNYDILWEYLKEYERKLNEESNERGQEEEEVAEKKATLNAVQPITRRIYYKSGILKPQKPA